MRRSAWITMLGASLLVPCTAAAQNIQGPPELKFSDGASVSQPSAFFETVSDQLAIGGDNGLKSSINTYSMQPPFATTYLDHDSGYYPGYILQTNFDGGLNYIPLKNRLATYVFTFGGVSERFAADWYDGSILYSLSQSGGLLIKNADGSFSYTDRSGVQYAIGAASGADAPVTWPVTKITYPNGRVIDIKYQTPPIGSHNVRRIIGVQDNTGWFIKYEYDEDTPSSDGSVGWSWMRSAKGGNRAIDTCPLAAMHCTLTKFKVALNDWTISTPNSTLSIGNAAGQKDRFTLDKYYQVTSYQKAGETTPGATYLYCGRDSSNQACMWGMNGQQPQGWYSDWRPGDLYTYYGKVYQATVRGIVTVYSPSQACNCGGDLVTTQFPGEHFGTALMIQKVPQDIYSQGEMTYYKFDDGRSVGYVVNPTNRITGYTDLAGATHSYTYDDRGNVTQSSVTPAGGGTALVTTANYPSTCDNYVTCNKPTWVKDPKGNTYNFSYDPTHGGVTVETEPADSNGVAPQKRYTYIQQSAVYYDDSGSMQSSSPLWLLGSESHCISSNWTGSACAAGSADEVVTTYDYGPTSGPNNLLLRGVAVTTGGVTRRTCYAYNALGDKISETTPGAGLTSCS